MGGRFGSIQARSVKRTHKWVCHVVAAYPNVSPGPMNGSILLRWTVRDHRLNPGPRPSPLRRRPPDARPSPGKARPRRRPRRRRKGLVCHQARHRRAWCCLASTRNRPALKTPPRNSWHWPDVKLLRNIGRALLHRDQIPTRLRIRCRMPHHRDRPVHRRRRVLGAGHGLNLRVRCRMPHHRDRPVHGRRRRKATQSTGNQASTPRPRIYEVVLEFPIPTGEQK